MRIDAGKRRNLRRRGPGRHPHVQGLGHGPEEPYAYVAGDIDVSLGLRI